MNETFNRLLLLLWKNWVMQKRRRKKLCIDTFIPLFIAGFLLYIRSAAEVYESPKTMIFKPFEVNYIPELMKMRSTERKKSAELAFSSGDASGIPLIGVKKDMFLSMNISEENSNLNEGTQSKAFIVWSPDDGAVNEIMKQACRKMNVQGKPMADSKELERIMTTSSEEFPHPREMILAGVAFPDNIAGSKIPLNMKVRIRFPAELRLNFKPGPAMLPRNWLTGLIFPMIQIPGPREEDANEGGTPSYYQEGFLGIQNAVSSSLLEYNLKNSAPNLLPKLDIKLKRYPYPKYVIDLLVIVMQNVLPLITCIGFLFSVNTIVEKITTEKEKKLKVIMNIMGCSESLRWTSWFVYSFIFFGLLITLLLIAFKVPLVYNRPVFPYSDWTCLAVFFVCYACATITYCFLMSSLFSKASMASIVSGMGWFLIFVPFYVIQQKYGEISTLTKCLSSLLVNTGMGIGFQIILMFESTGMGCQWSNFMTPATPDDEMTMALVIVMLIVDCVIYLCLALCIENVLPGKHRSPLPFMNKNPFQRSYWFRDETKITNTADENLNSFQEIDYPLEEAPKNLKPGIEIRNLRKVYKNNKAAVKNLCFSAYEDQITVLMGFNGAGKTTTLSILTGVHKATSGTAVVAGFDVRSNMKDVRKNLGFCPQYNVLFDELTVEEHLRFFNRLKGLSEEEVKEETEYYLTQLKLKDKKDTLAKHLSGGMKRKLSVTLAMCGKTKVLLFDEPTAGMDPRARRSLWDLLKAAKKGRTILITTHYMDEADLLGDRVAIMSEGKLSCDGSTFFLKQHFSCGYHLVIVKEEGCDAQKVTDLIRKYAGEEIIVEDVGMELSYQLDKKYLNKFEELFSAIENEKEALKITSFGVAPTTLEDVFKRIADNENKVTKTKVEDDRLAGAVREEGVRVNVSNSGKETGFSLLKSQATAMFYKHVKSTVRSWKSYAMLLIITIAGISSGIFTLRINNQLLNLPPRILDLENFPKAISSVQAKEGCDGSCRKFYEFYGDTMLKHKVQLINLNSSVVIDEYLLEEFDKNIFSYREKNALVTTFNKVSDQEIQIIGWFNGVPYHLSPIALSYIYNSIFRTVVDASASLTFVNEPLPYREETKANIQGSGLDSGFQIAIFVTFTYVFVASYFIIFPVHERGVKAKHLQFVSGVGSITFWSTSYLWNFFMSLGPNLTLLITLAALQEEGFTKAEQLGSSAVALMFFFLAVLPLIYLASLFFSKPPLGFILLSFFNIITGIFTVLLVMILQIPVLGLQDLANVLERLFSVFPLFAMSRSFQNIHKSSSPQICQPLYEQCLPIDGIIHPCCQGLAKCQASLCAERTESIFGWEEPGIGRYLTFSFGAAVVLFILLISLEKGFFNFLKRKGAPVVDSQNKKDSDVVAEREKINNLSEESGKNYGLLLKGITKSFKKNAAVNNLYLAVANEECFGLLGANGAGKTTTFRILTGEECPSSGNAYVKGLNLSTDLRKIHKLIGYCPQFDALFDNLTGREHLRIYCLLRGIPPSDIEETSVQLARELLFEQFLDRRVQDYSGGNKRKLSTALALIGNPPVIYLDEPTAGIDPVAKRHLWSVITKLRAQGTTIILTSHSMEECEALCTRLTVMVKGEFKCLGSVQYLKNKFCSGYSLVIKVKKQDPREACDPEMDRRYYISEIKRFIANHFPGATESEEHEELLAYRIPFGNITWSKMFGLIESVKTKFNIEDYSVGQTTLEDILMMFTGISADD